MATLKHAHRELYRRRVDERFESLTELVHHCRRQKERCLDRWQLPQNVLTEVCDGELKLQVGTDGAYLMNEWSFSQLCSLARVNKETVNRLMPETASLVFRETLPSGSKPLQILTNADSVVSIHSASYTRLWNTELLAVVRNLRPTSLPRRPRKEAVPGCTLASRTCSCS
jgi:hypothetical protein